MKCGCGHKRRIVSTLITTATVSAVVVDMLRVVVAVDYVDYVYYVDYVDYGWIVVVIGGIGVSMEAVQAVVV